MNVRQLLTRAGAVVAAAAVTVSLALAGVALAGRMAHAGAPAAAQAPKECGVGRVRGQEWVFAVDRIRCPDARRWVIRLRGHTVPPNGILMQGLVGRCSGAPVGRQPREIRCLFLGGAWFRAGLKATPAAVAIKGDLQPARCPEHVDTTGKRWRIQIEDTECATARRIIGAVATRPVPANGRYEDGSLPMLCSGSPAGRVPTQINCVGRNWAKGTWRYLQADGRMPTPTPGTTTTRTRP